MQTTRIEKERETLNVVGFLGRSRGAHGANY